MFHALPQALQRSVRTFVFHLEPQPGSQALFRRDQQVDADVELALAALLLILDDALELELLVDAAVESELPEDPPQPASTSAAEHRPVVHQTDLYATIDSASQGM